MSDTTHLLGRTSDRILAISFITRPNEGSEGGVGWSFLKAAGLLVSTGEISGIDFVYDTRDREVLDHAVSGMRGADGVRLFPVDIPSIALRRWGNRRTRGSYLSWIPHARRVTNNLSKKNDYKAAHQFTFATSSMPSALPRRVSRSVWGPLAAPEGRITAWGKSPSYSESLRVWLGKQGNEVFTRRADLIACQNDYTQNILDGHGVATVLEPNIVIEQSETLWRDDKKLVFSGNLIDRKRPWLALQALNHRSLRDYQLDFIGSGPLLTDLQSYVRQERMDSRVKFLGRLDRADAVARVGSAGALLLPSVREGAGWVVGEAASQGTPSVVFEATGAATIVRLSGGCGVVVDETASGVDTVTAFREGIITAVNGSPWKSTNRWSASRLPRFLRESWSH